MSDDRGKKKSFNRGVKSQLNTQETESTVFCNPVTLDVECELRLMVGDSSVKIELSSGLAEIYGSQMELNKIYSLPPNTSYSIFTWKGCVVKVIGHPEEVYIVKDTLMIVSVVLHASLEERRLLAATEIKKGPVIFVVGPNDVNRNALCRLLLNYAVRMGHSPLFLDLDVGQNSISLPSSIGLLPVLSPSDIVSGFDDRAIQVYPFGYRSPWQNMRLYSLLVRNLSQTLQTILSGESENIRTSGVIINGFDYSKSEIANHGYTAITHVVKNFEINILCVLQEESLYEQLQKDMPSTVEVFYIPKLEGDSDRSRHIKSIDRDIRIHKYFYGPTNELQPFTFEIDFSDIKIFKIGDSSIKRDIHSLADLTQSDVELKPVLLDASLIDQILGMSCADDVHEDIIYMPVVCFICITNVDIVKNTITVLSPEPSPLPKKIFLLGDTQIKKCE